MERPLWPRVGFGILLAFGALNAFGGGYYGMAGAEGVPVAWLSGSPFHSYFVPGLFLFFVVGGALGVAALAVLLAARWARPAALLAGAVLVLWIVAQVAIIGWVSWLQPVSGAAGLAVIALAATMDPVARRPV